MTIEELSLRYTNYKISIGEKFCVGKKTLESFAKHVSPYIDINKIDEAMCASFLYKDAIITRTWFSKYAVLKGMFEWGISRRYCSRIPLPTDTPKLIVTFKPYIYTFEELKRIFESSLLYQNGFQYVGKSVIIPEHMNIMLKLTYLLGLRIGESLSMKVTDIDMQESVITIQSAKFYKKRIVTFGYEVKRMLEDFLHKKKSSNIDSPLLFHDTKGRMMNIGIVDKHYRMICKLAKVSSTQKQQPRIHDLRHSFTVHTLTEWYRNNEDVQYLVPILSKYLGHKSISETATYITYTKELLNYASDKVENYIRERS